MKSVLTKSWMAVAVCVAVGSAVVPALGVQSSGSGQYEEKLPGFGERPGPAWENAPVDFLPMQRRGWHDGIKGARQDVALNRPGGATEREEYRHPSYLIPIEDQRDYKYGYKRGYEMAIKHLSGN